jgi:hypothetical protein
MTAPVDVTRSRRSLLAGALGGLGAWAASAVGRASPVHATNGDPLIAGATTTATATTSLHNTADFVTAFRVQSPSRAIEGLSTSGYGVSGESSSSRGLNGVSTSGSGVVAVSTSGFGLDASSSTSFGVRARSTDYSAIYAFNDAGDQAAISAHARGNSTGVIGASGSLPSAARAKTGVFGYANQDSGSKGVWGFSRRGVGIFGEAHENGIAIRAKGRIKADKVSGLATIPAGSTSVTVSPGVNVTSGSFVLLTPKANIGSRGLWFTTNANADSFAIRMSSSRSSNTKVAWLLLG